MKQNLLMNEIYVNEVDSRFQKKTTSTLRIPREMMTEFEAKVKEQGGVDRYSSYD
jgi:hypothetical protein